MPSKVPPDYFIFPEFLAIVFLPITWGLLPIAGFQPDLLANSLPTDIFQSILNAQVYVTDFSIHINILSLHTGGIKAEI